MQLRKYRWSKNYESAEEELITFLADRHLTATRHHLEAGSDAATFTTTTDAHVWCAEGSMVLTANNDGRFSLQPGDTLDIPTGLAYTLQAGMTGCVYYLSSVE